MKIKRFWMALPVLLCGVVVLGLALDVTPASATVRALDNDCSGGYIALTFDDGPGPNTPAVVAALQSLRLKATFFVNGNKLDALSGQQTLRDELAGGFSVQNHTYDHASFTGASTSTAP